MGSFPEVVLVYHWYLGSDTFNDYIKNKRSPIDIRVDDTGEEGEAMPSDDERG